MDLTKYVQQVSQEDFGWDFAHTARWNKRLKTTGGRFFPKDGHLDFNPKLYEAYGLEVFRRIVRHELCHYHLYYQNRGYKHGDKDFKQLLKQVNGLRYAPKLSTNVAKYLYECQRCGQQYPRRKRINTSRYRCGKCHGQLEYRNQS